MQGTVGMSKVQHIVEVDTHTVTGSFSFFSFFCKTLRFMENI